MKPSAKDADRLAKELHPYLTDQIAPKVLEEMGWFAFLDGGRPLTTSRGTMACHAFCQVVGMGESRPLRNFRLWPTF